MPAVEARWPALGGRAAPLVAPPNRFARTFHSGGRALSSLLPGGRIGLRRSRGALRVTLYKEGASVEKSASKKGKEATGSLKDGTGPRIPGSVPIPHKPGDGKKHSEKGSAIHPKIKKSAGFGLDLPQLNAILELGTDACVPEPASLARKLRTSLEDGISGDDDTAAAMATRAAALGTNRLPEPPQVTFWELLREALSDFTILVLIASGALSIVLEIALHSGPAGVEGSANWLEGAAILAAVVVVVMVSAVTNYQKEGQFRELNAAKSDIKVRVIRGGGERRISIFDIVVGDVVLLEIGDVLPADGVLFSGADIKVNESHLTGESDDVYKHPKEDNKLYSGSQVLEGYGKMLVLAVGPNSQQGLISTLVQQRGGGDGAQDDTVRTTLDDGSTLANQDTVLVQKLEDMAAAIGRAGLFAAVTTTALMAATYSYNTFVVAGMGWSIDMLEQYLNFLIIGITVLVVAVPEGLPLAVTLALAFSVRRMYEHQNLVRHLDACEALGCATTVCSDKTGTLTQNRMEVVRVWLGGKTFRGTHIRAVDSQDGGDDPDVLRRKGRRLFPLRPSDADEMSARSRALLYESITCNTTAQVTRKPNGHWIDVGNSTECALLRMVDRLKLAEECAGCRDTHDILRTWTFTSARKRMTVLLRGAINDRGTMNARAYSKGAAELMLERCSARINAAGDVEPLTVEDRMELLSHAGKDALRMLCVCYRDVEVEDSSEAIGALAERDVEKDMTLVCMLGIQDDLREGVDVSIGRVQRAGIDVKMLTGDNLATAIAVARQASILPPDFPLPGGALTVTLASVADFEGSENHGLSTSGQDELLTPAGMEVSLEDWKSRCVTCEPSPSATLLSEAELDAMAMEGPEFRKRVLLPDGRVDVTEFAKLWPRLRVLARCSPMDKYVLVQGCQALETYQGYREVVAMTGDGSNDAPALRLADVGLAMNSGTTIAKEASDIILMDNDFNTIVSGIKWGRGVYANITRFLQFQLTINIVAVVTACVGAAALQEAPLTAVQMLWVNLIMDSLASLSLATERPTNALLARPPYRSDAPLITPLVAKHITGQAAYQLLVMYGLLFHGSSLAGWDHEVALTMVFNTFVFMQLANQVNSRKIEDEPDVLDGFFTNRLFLGILAAEALLQVALVEKGGPAFRTTPLDLEQWAICLGFGAGTLLVRSVLAHVPTPAIFKGSADPSS